MRGLRAEMGWPQWCWLPMSAAHAVVGGGKQVAGNDPRAGDIALLAALAAWRQGRGIYRVDPELAEALAGTDLDGDLPVEVLYRLPEWCVYISGMGTDAYAHLEWDVAQRRPELRLLMSDAQGWLSVAVHLDRPTLAEAIESMLDQARANAVHFGIEARLPDDAVAQIMALARPVVAAVLYLCSADADVIDPDRPGAVPRRAMEPGEAPRVWDVGYRLATALRRARLGAGDHGGFHAAPRAHLRVPTVWATALHCLSSAHRADSAEGVERAQAGGALGPADAGGR